MSALENSQENSAIPLSAHHYHPLADVSILATLSQLARERHPDSDTKAVLAPEEADRVPMLERGVTLALLRRLLREEEALGRSDIDCGQFLNGVHTTDSATDWKEFDRARDAFSAKACCLHTGLSFVETMMAAGLTHDPESEAPYFGRINTFVSYTWRSDPIGPKHITFANLVAAVEDTLAANASSLGGGAQDPEDCAFFVDVLVCAQHRGVRPESSTCPNATDVGKFEEVVDACDRLLFFATPLTQPKALTRVWCLFEVMSAIKREKPVLVALTASDRKMLRELLLGGKTVNGLLQGAFDQLVALFTTIKSENADATVPADRDMIFGWIRRDLGDNGFLQLDQMVAGGMRLWLAETAKGLVEEAVTGGSEEEGGLEVAVLMDGCGKLLVELARLEEAEDMHRLALARKETAHGPDHPSTGTTLIFLALVLQDQNKLDEAEKIFRRALAIMEAAHGPDHPETGDALTRLAKCMYRKGELDGAEALHRRALAIKETALGKDDSSVGAALINLSWILQDKDKLDEAEDMLRRALAIYEMAYGPDHPYMGNNLLSLASVLEGKGELDEAEEMYRRALAIHETAHGLDHPSTANTLYYVAMLLQGKGELDEAEEMLRRVLAIEETAHGKDHADTIYVRGNIGRVQMLRGDGKVAVEGLEAVEGALRALKAPPHSLPSGHRWVVKFSGYLS